MAIAIEATIGRPMSQPRFTDEPELRLPRSNITLVDVSHGKMKRLRRLDLDMTRPTTSSMTAALTRTEPTRVWLRSTVRDAEAITANVVPVSSDYQVALQPLMPYPKK
jgi:post-segregation antitoxin (ccd killing protein)